MAHNSSSHPQKRYRPELRERALRIVLETMDQTGERVGVITRIARQRVSVPSRCAAGSARPRSTAAAAEACRPPNGNASPSWSERSVSCAAPIGS